MNLLRAPIVASLLLIGLVAPAGCHLRFEGVQGDGHAETQSRAVAGFTGVDSRVPVPVHIHAAESFSVVVTIDGNLESVIETTVRDGVLVVSATQSFGTDLDAVIDVGMPALTSAEAEASGDVTVTGFATAAPLRLATSASGSLDYAGQSGALDVSVTASGSMHLRGASGHLTATCSGSGSLQARQLTADPGADVVVSGSGSASITVRGDVVLRTEGSGSIDAALHGGTAALSVGGSGSIRWTGDASAPTVAVTGSGDVVRY